MKHLLIVHGVNNKHNNHAFKEYVAERFQPHIKNFDVVVLNDHHTNIYKVIESIIDSGETTIRMTPLTFFSTFEQLEMLPEVITTFNHTHPWVNISTTRPLTEQSFLKEIIERQLPQDSSEDYLVAFIGLGYSQIKLPNDELTKFISRFDSHPFKVKGFMLNGAMDYKELLPNTMRRYQHLIVVPLYFMPENVHNGMKKNLQALIRNKQMHILPSLTQSDTLLEMVVDEIRTYENNRIYI